MLFPSGFFLVWFLPLVLICYWLAPNRFRNAFLLLASIGFYAWGEPWFVFLLLGLTIVNFQLVRFLDKSTQRKAWLIAYLILNIGFLAVFKYTWFLLDNVQAAVGANWFDIPEKPYLPLGISFYAFHAITYGIDVYNRQFKALNNGVTFSLYLFLFPHQIAGPIVTYQSIAHELKERKFDLAAIPAGMYRFVIGLAKKVLISDGLILLIEACDHQQEIYPSSSWVWIKMLAYTFHIYFDFSGYSDMAIGLGQLFGFHFPENFNRPYTARSITDFWQRWHMSLGNFMKNYLYIPLGGNKNGSFKTYRNLLLVFFLSGLWHGASWNFVLWGLFHGSWLIIERLFLAKWLKKTGPFAGIWVFLIVLNGWVLFHETSFEQAVETYQWLWTFRFETLQPLRDLPYYQFLLFFCTIWIILEYLRPLGNWRIKWVNSTHVGIQLARFAWMAILYLACFSYVIAGNYSPFIYFNF